MFETIDQKYRRKISNKTKELVDRLYRSFGENLKKLSDLEKIDFNLSDFQKEISLYDDFFSDEDKFDLEDKIEKIKKIS